MSAATKQDKHYHIKVVINLKRSKEEISFAEKETVKLYNLIGSDKSPDWAMRRIEKIHEMIFMPDAKKVESDLVAELKKDGAIEGAPVETETDDEA